MVMPNSLQAYAIAVEILLTMYINDVYLSVASIWEATVKYQLGKLPLPESPEKYLPNQRIRHQIACLSIDEGSIAKLIDLPPTEIRLIAFSSAKQCSMIYRSLLLIP